MILLDYYEMVLKNEPLLSGDLTIDEYLKFEEEEEKKEEMEEKDWKRMLEKAKHQVAAKSELFPGRWLQCAYSDDLS